MRITINPTLNMETLEWVSNDGTYEYNGPVANFLGGASGQDTALAKDQKTFEDTMQQEQATAFANDQNALNIVMGSWAPIAKGGPNAYGFSTGEDETLRSGIVDAGQTAATNTENAALLREQQASGGASTMPAGGTEALNAQIAATGAQTTAAELNQEKELGYETGRSEFNTAQAGLSEVASLENPAGLGTAATAAGEDANKSQNQVDTANANSLGAKLLGGVIGAIPAIAGGVATGGMSNLGKGVGFFG